MSFLKFLIGWPLTIVAFFFIVKLIAPQSATLLSSIAKVQPALFIYGIMSFVLFYFLRSYIWYRLLKNNGDGISFKQSCYLWAASELKRYAPGNIWSFLGRTVLFSERGVKKKDIAKSLIIEAELFVLGCLSVSVLSLPFITPSFSFSSPIGVATLSLLTLVLLIFTFSRHSGRVPSSLARMTAKIFAFLLPPYSPKENFTLISLSSLALIFFGLGNYFIIGSLIPLHPQMIWELTGFFVLSFLAGYLSILTPAGFGVREGIVIYGLSKITTVTLSSFAALFSRLILILSELIFILLAYFWHHAKNKTLLQTEQWIANHKHEVFVLFLMLIYTIYFTTVSFLRYENFYTGRFDLGNMVQTVWNTMHGSIFTLTNPNGTETISRLAFHADFILILLAPFYALWPDPKMLLLIQTIVLAGGAFFVYLISKHVLKNKNISLAFAFAYLINPAIQWTNLYDFHPVTLATTFLLATYYFYLKKKYRFFILFAILAALCKEHLWLIIALFGGLLIIRQKKFLLGAAVSLLSISMFYFLIWHAIPGNLGSQHFALSYYSDFGESPTSVVKSIILSPQKILALVFEESRFNYLIQLFSPLGYLSLLAPFFLIFAGPDFIVNLLSNNAQLHQIFYQYTATITPFLFIAAIWGMWTILHLVDQNYQITNKFKLLNTKRFGFNFLNFEFKNVVSLILISYLLASSLSAAYQFGPLPGSRQPSLDMLIKPIANKAYIENYLSQFPSDYSIAASNNIGSHLSQRENIYVVPLVIDKSDLIILLLTDPWTFKTDTELVKKLKADNYHKLIIEKDRFFVFSK